jgi:hypothetical protein
MNELIQLGRASFELHEFEKRKAKDNKAGYASSAAIGAAMGGLTGKYRTTVTPLGTYIHESKRLKLERQKSNRRMFGRRTLVGAGIGALVSEAARRMNNKLED